MVECIRWNAENVNTNKMVTKEEIRGLAGYMHEIYERKAKEVGWKTQDTCKVEFDDLPDTNKEVMLYTAKQVIEWLNQSQVNLLMNMAKEIDSSQYLDTCIEEYQDLN